MEITLETVVFYFLAAFITVCSILDGNDPPHGALGHLPAVRAFRYGRHLLSAGLHLPRFRADYGLCRRYRSALRLLHTAYQWRRRSIIEKLKRSRFLAGLGATVGGAIIVVFITLEA